MDHWPVLPFTFPIPPGSQWAAGRSSKGEWRGGGQQEDQAMDKKCEGELQHLMKSLNIASNYRKGMKAVLRTRCRKCHSASSKTMLDRKEL